eukprot:scaffold42117_cov40-Cyclotella_meneghiniana.AAC.1
MAGRTKNMVEEPVIANTVHSNAISRYQAGGLWRKEAVLDDIGQRVFDKVEERKRSWDDIIIMAAVCMLVLVLGVRVEQ